VKLEADDDGVASRSWRGKGGLKCIDYIKRKLCIVKTRIIGGDLVGGSRSEWGALCVTQRALQCDVSDTEQTTRRTYLGARCSHHKQHNDHNLSQSYQLSFHQTKIWRHNDNLMRVTQPVVRRCEPPCTNYLTLPTSFDRKKLQIEMTRPTSCVTRISGPTVPLLLLLHCYL